MRDNVSDFSSPSRNDLVGQITAHLCGPAMALGDVRRSVTDLPDFDKFFLDQGLPVAPEMLGMERFHAAGPNQTRWQMAIQSAQDTLVQTGVNGSQIDGLIFCSAHFGGTLTSLTEGLQNIAQAINVKPDMMTGVTLGRCASFLAGIKLAQSLVASGAQINVLVISADRYDADSDRLQPFALFSDGAASCLISAHSQGATPIAIRSIASRTDPTTFDVTGRISPTMVQEVNALLTAQTGIAVADVTTVLPTNIFQPVVFAAESQGGAPADKLFLSNIAARGHCFGADPIINLIDYQTQTPFCVGDTALLCATVPGLRVAMIVQAI